MSKKAVVIYLDEPGKYDYPFTKDMYLTSYYELSKEIESLGAKCYIARSPDSYLGKNVFSNTLVFKKKGVLVSSGKVTADAIYDKGDKDTFKFNDVSKIINDRFVNELCVDKNETYKVFREYSPVSLLANTLSEVNKIVEEHMSTEKFVVKPYDGFEGHGVQILDKGNKIKIDDVYYPVVVQEFIDSSRGVPGIVKGTHDVRLVMKNEEIVMSFVRTPPAGSLLANVAQGGSLDFFDYKLLPKKTFELVGEINKYFEGHEDRVYSIDLAFEGDRPYIIELNSRPALWPKSYSKQADNFQKVLAGILAD